MTAAVEAEPSPRASARQWAGLAVLALPTVLLALDLTVLYMALPHLGADLGATNTQLLWITDIYGFMVAGLLITMGNVGDRIGRRRLLLIGATAFGMASVLAAYSSSPEMLIATRAALGIAGATLMPSTLSLIRTMFLNPQQRGLAIGIWMMSFALGAAIGPAVGGALLEFFWWGSVFLLGVPVMLLLLATGPVLLPEYRGPAAGRLDLTSVALSLGAILPLVYGLKEIARDGVRPGSAVAIAVGVAAGWLFVRRQRRLAAPLLDLRLFRNRRFSGAVAALTLGTLLLTAFTLFFTQHLQLVEGLSPLRAGLWFVPMALAVIVASLGAPLLARRIRPAYLIVSGLLVAVAGMVALTQLQPESGLWLLIASSVVFAIGMEPLLVLSTDLVVGSVPPETAGLAAGTSETGGELGMAMGIATLGTLGAAVYSSQMAGTLPDGTPVEAAEAARDSFARAFTVAQELPDPLGAELMTAAEHAFTAGFNVVAAASAVVLVAVVVLVLTVLRQVPPLREQAGGEPEPARSEPPAKAKPVPAGD